MPSNRHVRVEVDLQHVRRNVQAVATQAGVPIIAVIKADAYGLGAQRVAPAIADLVDSFCVFAPDEAAAIDLYERTGKPAIAIGPPAWADADEYLAREVRPAVANVEDAIRLTRARPILCVDTGQQRFACPMERVPDVLGSASIDEAFTHAINLAQVCAFRAAVEGRVGRLHAAGTSLIGEPAARLDAVRPGLALYLGATRVWTRLTEVHRGTGPAGYSGFVAPHHGIILAGYSHGLRTGPCLVNGRPSRILEVGMQSAFVQTDPNDAPGDPVVLLGDGLTEHDLAAAAQTSPHEVLVRLSNAGEREYAGSVV